MSSNVSWLESIASTVAPRWALRRARYRVALEMLQRHYEGAGTGRRQQGWRRSSQDANATNGPALARLRENARDLVRNNPYAESAVSTIADQAVGWGIVPNLDPRTPRILDAWRAWGETTACDADGRHDFYGLQKLAIRTVVESGEVLVRRRLRRPEDGLPIPMQLQLLDPDFLDTSRDTSTSAAGTSTLGGVVDIQGVRFDPIGRRIGYWLFPAHPGSNAGPTVSVLVPADSVLHMMRGSRPGQVRAVSWFAPILLKMRDHDEFEDATLMKQKIAACLAVLTTDPDGQNLPLGTKDDTQTPPVDALEPGMIIPVPAGQSVTVVDPPAAGDYEAYSRTQLRAIATGIGIPYEDLTGDYVGMPFSAARASRIRHRDRVHDWRWRILIPQFCGPTFAWFVQAASIMGQVPENLTAAWTPPPLPMVDPQVEGLATMRNIRAGLTSLSEAQREQGYDPDDLLEEIAADNARLDELGIVLDSDARNMTQGGQLQGAAAKAFAPDPPKVAPPAAAPAAEDPPKTEAELAAEAKAAKDAGRGMTRRGWWRR